MYLATGFYTVQPEEEAVEMIFGKYSNTVGPGLRYNYPSPIGKILKVKVKTVNRQEIGSKSYSDNTANHGEVTMLTGDENIVNINFDVQWRIGDIHNYLFKLRDSYQGLTVKNAAESAMREVIGRNVMSFAIEGKGRASIAYETKVLLQKILDSYESGIEVLSIQLKKVDPPEKVISAFRDVQSARADKERVINEAYAYSNDILPRAKGEAIRIKLSAEAYENEVVKMAEGTSKSFIAIYNEYKNRPEAVEKRLYLETMEDVLKQVEKIILTDDSKSLSSHMFLNNLNNKGK